MKGTETKEGLREELIRLKSRINEMEKSLDNCNKMEIALKKSEERFRAFAESATDGIVTTDVYGNILFFK